MSVPLADVARGVQEWWAPGLAFAAGVVSFASPCVLPLVPGYLSFVAGGQGPDGGRRPVLPILAFIAGFTVVFTVLFGFTATAVRGWLISSTGHRVAGAVVLLFGMFMLLYAFRLGMPWLYREERPLLSWVKPGPAGAFPLGMAFAVGWTPCIGPVLGAISTLAANQQSTPRVVLLLLMYSLGLGLPFFLIGIGLRRMLGALRFFSRNYHWFAGVGGTVMVTIGVLLISGQWTRVMAPVFDFVNRFTPAL